MEGNKEQSPKFNPEFNYLENPRILELQLLFDEVVSANSEDVRENKLVIFQRQWKALLEKYLEKGKVGEPHLKQLLRFFRYNLRILDKGGMLLGRSKIGIFMSAENERLVDRFDDLIEG